MRIVPFLTRLIPYLLYLFMIAFYRASLNDLFSIGPAHIFLSALVVILVALNKDYPVSIWFGCVAGLIYDAQNPTHIGVHMILFAILGSVTAQVKDRLNLGSLRSNLILVSAGLFLYSIPYVMIYETSGTSEFLLLIAWVAIPSVIYTTIVSSLFFMIQSGQLSYKKLKTIF